MVVFYITEGNNNVSIGNEQGKQLRGGQIQIESKICWECCMENKKILRTRKIYKEDA